MLFFFFLTTPQGLQDLSSLTRDPTGDPAAEARSLNHWTTREVLLLMLLLTHFRLFSFLVSYDIFRMYK